MRKKYWKIVSIMLIVVLLVPPILAADMSVDSMVTYISYNEWENNMLSSNTIIENFFSYYKDDPNAEPNLPYYFAGFDIHPDGTLTMYSTDISKRTEELIYGICESDEFDISLAYYSFEYLIGLAEEICDNSDLSPYIECAFISILNNRIDFYMSENQSISTVASAIGRNTSIPVSIYAFTSMGDAVRNTYNQKAEKVIVSPNPLIDSSIAPLSTNSTTIKYGGPANSSGFNCTVGYLALDTSGDKILITHGHDLIVNRTFKYGGIEGAGTSVGAVTTIVGNAFPLDASIVTLYDNTTITNQASWNSSVRFSSVVGSNTEISSVNGQIAYFHGNMSGEVSGEVIYNIEEGECFLINGDESVDGDSGAPVYFKTTNTSYKLIGIQTGWRSAGIKVTTVPDIKDSYPHYVYLNSNSYT